VARVALLGAVLPMAASESGHFGGRPRSRSVTGSCRALPGSGVSAIPTLELQKAAGRRFEPRTCAIYPERSGEFSTGSLNTAGKVRPLAG